MFECGRSAGREDEQCRWVFTLAGTSLKHKTPGGSEDFIRFFFFPQTFFIRGEWNTFSRSPSRTFK